MVFPLGPDRRDALSYVGGGAAHHVGLASRLPNHKNSVEMHPLSRLPQKPFVCACSIE